MVETFIKGNRTVLVLGKFRVIERRENSMKIALGGSTTMSVLLPIPVDVREGDILTFYTEVLSANPGQTDSEPRH